MKNTSRYKNTNATLEAEVKERRLILEQMKSGRLDFIDGTKPCAIPYGVADKDGRKKLFKYCPVFYSMEAFEVYVRKHKQIVLAVYNRL